MTHVSIETAKDVILAAKRLEIALYKNRDHDRSSLCRLRKALEGIWGHDEPDLATETLEIEADPGLIGAARSAREYILLLLEAPGVEQDDPQIARLAREVAGNLDQAIKEATK